MRSLRTRRAATVLFVVALCAQCGWAAERKREILFLDQKAFEKYLAKHCDGGNECTSGTNGSFTDGQSDCAHFVAHALAAGGVKVAGKDVSCDKGLVVRVLELRKWLDDAAGKYANVEQVPGWQKTRAYDVGFIEFFYVRRWDVGFDAVHALVLAEASKEKSGTFFAHTNSRCGKEDVSYGKDGIDRPVVFFRINPSPLNGGKWADGGNVGTSRFVLTFDGRDVTLVERGLETSKDKTQTLKLKFEDDGTAGKYVIRRANDDATLQLLSYTNASLRRAILERNPEPSTLTATLGDDDDTINIEWRGLRVTKKRDGSLDQMTQPSAATPAKWVFKRVK